jgi:hypothetical protein
MADTGMVSSWQHSAPLVVVLDDGLDTHILVVPLDKGVFHLFVLPVPALIHIHVEHFPAPWDNVDRDLIRAQVLGESQIRPPTSQKHLCVLQRVCRSIQQLGRRVFFTVAILSARLEVLNVIVCSFCARVESVCPRAIAVAWVTRRWTRQRRRRTHFVRSDGIAMCSSRGCDGREEMYCRQLVDVVSFVGMRVSSRQLKVDVGAYSRSI